MSSSPSTSLSGTRLGSVLTGPTEIPESADADRRSDRRRKNTTDESHSSTASIITTRDAYRIGSGDNMLSPTPLRTQSTTPHCPSYEIWKSMEPQIRALLEQRNMGAIHVDLVYRIPYGDMEFTESDLVILVVAYKKEATDDWVLAIQAIQEICEDKFNEVMNIEFCDPRALHGKRLFAVPFGHPIAQVFDPYHEALQNILYVAGSGAYDVARLAYIEEDADHLTVILSIPRRSLESVQPYISRLKTKWAAAQNMRLEFVIRHDYSFFGGHGPVTGNQQVAEFARATPMAVQRVSVMGNTTNNFGTIGGYFQAEDTKTGKQGIVAHTCYHIVQGDLLDKIRSTPLSTAEPDKGLSFQVFDINTTVPCGVLEAKNAGIPKSELSDRWQKLCVTALGQDLLDVTNPIIVQEMADLLQQAQIWNANQQRTFYGYVIAASGERDVPALNPAKRFLLDWALIGQDNENHKPMNSMPETISLWNTPTFNGFTPQGSLITKIASVSQLSESKNPQVAHQYLFKNGVTTGFTVGISNGIASCTFSNTKRLTMSWMVLPLVESHYGSGAEDVEVTTRLPKQIQFCAPGDSGAWVLTKDGEVIGQLSGGDNWGDNEGPQYTRGAGYWTPMEDLIPDMENLMGCKLSLLPPPVF